MTASAFYEGTVSHRRHSVREHAFRYRVSMAYLDLDELGGLEMARRRFRRSDHIGDPARPLKETGLKPTPSERGIVRSPIRAAGVPSSSSTAPWPR